MSCWRISALAPWKSGDWVRAGQSDQPGPDLRAVSGYGQSGPYANRPGFASVCEGLGGLRYINGFPANHRCVRI